MSVTRSLSLTILLALLPVPLLAQEAIDAGRSARHDVAIRIYSLTGSLRITAWEHDSVHVRGRVDRGVGKFFFGGTREALKLGVEIPDGVEPDGTADLDIQVPAGTRLWVKSAAAEVDITAGGGMVEVINGSGRVRVAGRAESATVETIDGNVELALESPSGRVRTASGTIVVRGVVRDLEATTVSGPLLVGMEGAVQRAHLETVASEIAFKGDLEPEGRLEAETHGGDVELRLPPRLGAAYHLVSYGGALINELVPASAVHPGPHKGEWTFTTGDGRATVDVRTFKGRVTLKVRGDPPR
ncbi:MAG: hypothetical protein ABI742_10605 [Gemmatimonadota bacterium]